MDTPRILFPFLGAGVGGSHVATFELARALESQFGVHCRILCSERSAIAQEAERYGLVSVFTGERPAMRHGPLYDMRRLSSRLGILTAARAGRTIVHCNDLGALQSWGPPAKLLGLPTVYHHHSLNRPALPNRMTLALADAYVCVSDICRANLSFVPPAKVSVALNPFSLAPVDAASERARMLADIGAPREAILFGFVGNFWRRKRPLFFLDACSVIAAREARAHFLMFGREGDLGPEDLRARAAELGIADRVHLMGFRVPAEANIAALDAVLAPAVREPFGRTLVEALLLGVPYAATADAGHGEIHARWGGGRLVDKHASAEHFAAMALALAGAPTLAPARRAEIAAEVSAVAHAEHMLGVYRAVSRSVSALANLHVLASPEHLGGLPLP